MARLAVNGAAGRMGRQLLSAIAEREQRELSAAFEIAGNAAVGCDASVLARGVPSGVTVRDSLSSHIKDFDVLIDFTIPEASLAVLDAIEGSGKALVIGTTGFTAAQKDRIREASQQVPIVFAPNFSVGVTLCVKLLELAAGILGDDYDIEVIEAHHRNKVDAPSGTALRFGEAIATALDRSLPDCAIYGRQGNTGVRTKSAIGFETIRGGDIIGDHTVLFAGIGERVEITHKATDRMTFARGAVRAADWLAAMPAGLYDMSDVIGLAADTKNTPRT